MGQFIYDHYTGTNPFFSQIPAPESFVSNLLAALPYYMDYAVYLLLLVFWWRLYASSAITARQFARDLFLDWGVLCGVLYAIWVVDLMLIASLPNHQQAVFMFTAGYALLINLFFTFAFAYVGVGLFRSLRGKQLSPRSRQVASRIFVMTGLSSFMYAAHFVIVVLELTSTNDSVFSYVSVFIEDFLLELVPVFLLLAIIHWPQPKKLGPDPVQYAPENWRTYGTTIEDQEFIVVHSDFGSDSDTDVSETFTGITHPSLHPSTRLFSTNKTLSSRLTEPTELHHASSSFPSLASSDRD
ncbi:MAG: hypothetical protein Q8P67_25910 [archaeon]|nr:hypothetical protein [archaeon]